MTSFLRAAAFSSLGVVPAAFVLQIAFLMNRASCGQNITMNKSSAGDRNLRKRLGATLFDRVAGPSGAANRVRIHDTPGPRWFDPDRPIRTVHGDASMFIGGLSALLLQSLHPLAMTAVTAHSGFRGDPWGRLQRTSTFLAVTTYGTTQDAQDAVDRVRAVHERVRGTTATGEPYRAADPHLLAWVHGAEGAGLRRRPPHRRSGPRRLRRTPSRTNGSRPRA